MAIESRSDLPEERYVESLKQQLQTAEYDPALPAAVFFADAIEVTFNVDGTAATEHAQGRLVRRTDEGEVAYVDIDKGGWVKTQSIDIDELEPLSLDEAREMANRLRVPLMGAPVAGDRKKQREDEWDYYSILLVDGTQHGLIRRSKPYTIQRLTDDGWILVPRLEKMFTVGVGGDQGDVVALSKAKAVAVAARMGFKL